jgi:integrase
MTALIEERVSTYLALQRSLGKKYNDETKILCDFQRYCAERSEPVPISQQTVMAFAMNDPKRSAARSWKRYDVVRRFAQYLAIFDPSMSTMDPRALRRHRRKPIPFVLDERELARVMLEAKHPSKSLICAATHHTVFGLAASTGVRVGEIVKLNRDDVDLASGLLHIRSSKFRKDREVPMHSSTTAAMREYAALRDVAFGSISCSAFFISSTREGRYKTDSLTHAFREAAERASVRRPDGMEPTLHSLRHTFAVRRLVGWYREGEDVQALLPALATYMGHVHYTTTAYYLTATPELMLLAAQRAERHVSRSESDDGS